MTPPMTPAQWERVQQVFADALSAPADERDALIAARLADDATLAAEVRRMLAAHDATGPLDRLADWVDAGAAGPGHSTVDQEAGASPVRIGVWRIASLLGRGGMGSVYLADRDDGQYAQRAAIKLLRRDVADPDVRRRFLAERRILGRIEHPGIARILDGGVTDEGRPWFALEYVEGLPLVAWCDERQLDVRARLALFRQVCAAVQHAHRHLVVHRDIKPANVLVTHDGHVKLLDFGIARLLDADAFPEDAGGTHTGALLLTPGYASPEQLRGEPVHTASDVFQLGILLFELLAGRPPRRHETAEAAGGTTGERPSAVANEPLRRAIDRDLDTIVQAATRAEPDRRYASADRLAEDVQRWLEGRPILARPDTLSYRAGRFVRRHTASVALASLLFLSLAAFAGVTAVQARRLERERDRARHVGEFLTDLFRAPDPRVSAGAQVSAHDVLDRGVERLNRELRDPLLRAELLGVLGDTYSGLGDNARALSLRTESLALLRAGRPDPLALAEAQRAIAVLLAQASQPDSALPHIAEAVRILRRHAPRTPALLRAVGDHAYVHMVRGDEAAAEPFFREALALYDRLPDPDPLRLAIILTNYGWTAQSRGDLPLAEDMMRRALALRRDALPEGDLRLAGSLRSLAGVLRHAARLAAADSASSENLAIVTRTFSPPHPEIASALALHATVRSGLRDPGADTLFALALAQTREVYGPASLATANLANELGWHYLDGNDRAAAAHWFGESAAAYRAVRGARHSSAAIVAGNQAWTLWQLDRLAEADSILRDVIDAMDEAWPAGDNRLAARLSDRGAILTRLARHDDAEPLLRRGLAMMLERRPADAPDPPPLVLARIRLGECLVAQGRFDEAEPLYLAAHDALATGSPDHADTRAHRLRLIDLYDRWQRPNDAARYRALLATDATQS